MNVCALFMWHALRRVAWPRSSRMVCHPNASPLMLRLTRQAAPHDAASPGLHVSSSKPKKSNKRPIAPKPRAIDRVTEMEMTHPGPCKDLQWPDDPLPSPPATFQTVMALDETVRHIDADGHLHITKCFSARRVSRPIGDGKSRTMHVSACSRTGFIRSFVRLTSSRGRHRASMANRSCYPICPSMPPTSARHDVGAVGKAVFDGETVSADLTFWDNAAIDSISAGVRRGVSAGYSYRVVAEAGLYEGQEYGLKMDVYSFQSSCTG